MRRIRTNRWETFCLQDRYTH